MHVHVVCDSETEAGSSSIDDDYNILGWWSGLSWTVTGIGAAMAYHLEVVHHLAERTETWTVPDARRNLLMRFKCDVLCGCGVEVEVTALVGWVQILMPSSSVSLLDCAVTRQMNKYAFQMIAHRFVRVKSAMQKLINCQAMVDGQDDL